MTRPPPRAKLRRRSRSPRPSCGPARPGSRGRQPGPGSRRVGHPQRGRVDQELFVARLLGDLAQVGNHVLEYRGLSNVGVSWQERPLARRLCPEAGPGYARPDYPGTIGTAAAIATSRVGPAATGRSATRSFAPTAHGTATEATSTFASSSALEQLRRAHTAWDRAVSDRRFSR
jgi:hypothetical protein